MKFDTSFTVFPSDANFNVPPCIFGGKMLAEMDICAAIVCRRALYGTECTDSVTVNANVDFFRPAYVGDLILINGKLIEAGTKSLVVQVNCIRESKETGKTEPMASGKFTFVSRKNGIPHAHGITIK